MRKDEDKIVSILNKTTDVNLDNLYHNTLARVREEGHINDKAPSSFKRGLRTSLLAVMAVVFFSIPFVAVMISITGTKNASFKDDTGEGLLEPGSDHFQTSESINSIYGHFITENVAFDETYLYIENITKTDMEKIFKEFNIEAAVVEDINTYSLVIGKIKGSEKLAYTNGYECIVLDNNSDYKVYDIYLNLKSQAKKEIENISLYIEGDNLVYYYSDGSKVYKYTK